MRPMASSSELMMKCTFKQLRSENEHLRNLVVSITATVLRNVAVDFYKSSRAANSTDAEQFVRGAEDCFRCARIPGLKADIANGLEVARHQLLAKAVEIEAIQQRMKWKK
jgi:hypothetical protein